MAQAFFGQGLDRWRDPGFGHETRWRTTAAVKRLLRADIRAAGEAGGGSIAGLLGDLPDDFRRWSYLAQDQYLEVRTLLGGYLLSAQGDRMLMGNSIEGRFPFLDKDVIALAGSLPDSYKLRGLDEKHVLKRLGRDILPPEILARPKQPYRAPDALAFVGDGAPGWIEEAMSAETTAAAGVFEPTAVAHLWAKCRAKAATPQFSNTDNMAVVGVLSTHLVWQQIVSAIDDAPPPALVRTVVER
jgi:asparagine synthase (glutamine-hydrolysing)